MSEPRYALRGTSGQQGRGHKKRPSTFDWPLVLTRCEAAAMCRISVQTFDEWVRKEILPGPIPGTRRWSRLAIERALAGETATSPAQVPLSPFEEWKHRNAN